MSVQINQFLMYGVKLDADKVSDEFYDKYESFMDDSAFKSTVTHKDGIFCCFDGMNGNFAVVGKVIQKAEDGEYIEGPVEISNLLSKKEKAEIKASIQRNFEGDLPSTEWACDYIFLTKWR